MTLTVSVAATRAHTLFAMASLAATNTGTCKRFPACEHTDSETQAGHRTKQFSCLTNRCGSHPAILAIVCDSAAAVRLQSCTSSMNSIVTLDINSINPSACRTVTVDPLISDRLVARRWALEAFKATTMFLSKSLNGMTALEMFTASDLLKGHLLVCGKVLVVLWLSFPGAHGSKVTAPAGSITTISNARFKPMARQNRNRSSGWGDRQNPIVAVAGYSRLASSAPRRGIRVLKP
jgi:hypothetical protein